MTAQDILFIFFTKQWNYKYDKQNEPQISRTPQEIKCTLPHLFYKVAVLKNFIKFREKHLRLSIFFNKVEDLEFNLFVVITQI